ncbi:hypothetical protein PV325_007463 [Microctonus aethiopoides]|nr:hypothetical protein PV325_007463 [Microctonus aethiopoides]
MAKLVLLEGMLSSSNSDSDSDELIESESWDDIFEALDVNVNERHELARRTKMIAIDIPEEFPRKMRSTAYHEIFKAAEYEFFVKYCGPIVLKKLVHEQFYHHFIFLHVACRLLSHENAPNYTTYARSYFDTYVKAAAKSKVY